MVLAMKRHAPAAERNREPIRSVLETHLPRPGLVLEIDLSEPVTITPTVGRHQVASELDVTEVLITPTRPGELIRHAAGRDIATAPA